MSIVKLGAAIFSYPMPVTLIGTHNEGKDNFMTAAWVSLVSHTPPRIAVTLGRHLTTENIHATGVFSVCFPSVSNMVNTDYCGITTGAKEDKSQIFSVFSGETGAPMIRECALNVECRLNHIDANGANETFIGDIVEVYADEAVLTNGKADLSKLEPLILSQVDKRYFSLGENVGKAWYAGRERH